MVTFRNGLALALFLFGASYLYDEELARRLWQVSESMSGVRYAFTDAQLPVEDALVKEAS